MSIMLLFMLFLLLTMESMLYCYPTIIGFLDQTTCIEKNDHFLYTLQYLVQQHNLIVAYMIGEPASKTVAKNSIGYLHEILFSINS